MPLLFLSLSRIHVIPSPYPFLVISDHLITLVLVLQTIYLFWRTLRRIYDYDLQDKRWSNLLFLPTMSFRWDEVSQKIGQGEKESEVFTSSTKVSARTPGKNSSENFFISNIPILMIALYCSDQYVSQCSLSIKIIEHSTNERMKGWKTYFSVISPF